MTVAIETLDTRVTAVHTRVIPDIDPRSRRYVLIATLPASELPLAPGMSVTAALPTGAEAELVRMPSDALMRDGGGYFVYRVLERPQQGMVVAPVTVQLRYGEDESIWVAAPDLQNGDRVVVEGNERLRPMQPIQITGPGAEPENEVPPGSGKQAGEQDRDGQDGVR